jgi:hypothetical protein
MTPEEIKALQAVVEEVKVVDVKIGRALDVFAQHIIRLGGGEATQPEIPAQPESSTASTSIVPTPAVKGDIKNGN